MSTDTFGSNDWLVDEMRRRYLDSPQSVSDSWRRYFENGSMDSAADGNGHPASTDAPVTAAAAATAPESTTSSGSTAPPVTPSDEASPAPSSQPATPAASPTGTDDEIVPLVGVPARIAERMEESRELPTATSVRSIPAKLLEVNRRILNNQLQRLSHPGKVSFTHIIGWAVIRAISEQPSMNVAYREIDGKPHAVHYDGVSLGLAMDMPQPDGSRTLLVPNIKDADSMTFREYWLAYEDMVSRVRNRKITPDDFAGTTATLTNPGTVGTVQSVPRLMPDQGVIVGVGAIAYPPEYQGSDPGTLAQLGVGRTITMTSTYDHRVIQGAESGLFLKRIHELLLGEDRFYDEIFESMHIPYVPARWAVDDNPLPGSRRWVAKQARVFQLINIYRVRGHLIADLDPLRQDPPTIHPELDPLTYGITIWDLDREFAAGGLGGHTLLTAGKILGLLRDAYCRTIGIEYMHIQVPEEKEWIQAQVEVPQEPLTLDEKRRLLQKLNEAEALERFIHTKFLGHKRFSLEGSESMIALLDTLLNDAADAGMVDVTIGMAHRGRLNVLANIIGKSYAQIFREFEGGDSDTIHGSGDVKYHLGATGVHKSPNGNRTSIEVASNPSHLEAIDPVLEGMVRAKQDLRGTETAIDEVLPVLIHGDAAFAGQGVVAETLNLSQLEGYHTGGTIHLVVNNQVGFTTDAADARSTFYATDMAKAVQAPIFHVNGDDPEAVLRVARLAFAYRQRFHKDVVIDLLGYRRLGHNEGDDPSLTQPSMYRVIQDRPSVRELYLDRLVSREELSREEGEAIGESFKDLLDQAFADIREDDDIAPVEAPAEPADPRATPDTGIDAARLSELEGQLAAIPEGFTLHPKLTKVLDDRNALFQDGWVDWALGEALAMATLAQDGHRIRLAGEDSRRGTFSHRHAVLTDFVTETDYSPLESLESLPSQIQIVDSMLSEFAAMGFEYGYSVVAQDALVMWEAQFGDFVNGAQVIIDQFLSAGYDKWLQESGLVLLLPHGYEGQGPEHSSARIERFLTMAVHDNMRIIEPSNPAQYFHALRRQVTAPRRLPLVVFTPKSLLRTRASYSPVEDLTSGTFQRVLDDPESPSNVRRVVLCTGKVFYDLADHRSRTGVNDVALVRIEELAPFPGPEVETVLNRYPDAEVVWAQEEPENMGPWRHVYFAFTAELGRPIRVVSRPPSASPATGSHSVHQRQQKALVEEALAADR